MSLDTLNNGDSGLDARTKINAAIAAVNAGTILRATGTLQAYTVGAQAPPPLIYTVHVVPADSDILVLTSTTMGLVSLTFSSVGNGGSIDTSSGDTTIIAGLVAGNMPGGGILGVSSGNIVTISNSNIGSAEVLSTYQTPAGWGASGGGNGSDATGNINSVELVPAVTGQSIKIIAAWFDGTISGMNQALRSSGSHISQDGPSGSYGQFQPLEGGLSAWFDGVTSDYLSVDFTTDLSGLPSDGSTCTVSVIYQQI